MRRASSTRSSSGTGAVPGLTTNSVSPRRAASSRSSPTRRCGGASARRLPAHQGRGQAGYAGQAALVAQVRGQVPGLVIRRADEQQPTGRPRGGAQRPGELLRLGQPAGGAQQGPQRGDLVGVHGAHRASARPGVQGVRPRLAGSGRIGACPPRSLPQSPQIRPASSSVSWAAPATRAGAWPGGWRWRAAGSSWDPGTRPARRPPPQPSAAHHRSPAPATSRPPGTLTWSSRPCRGTATGSCWRRWPARWRARSWWTASTRWPSTRAARTQCRCRRGAPRSRPRRCCQAPGSSARFTMCRPPCCWTPRSGCSTWTSWSSVTTGRPPTWCRPWPAMIPGMRGIYAGRLRNCGQVEALTANLVSVNRRYKAHAGYPGHRRLTGPSGMAAGTGWSQEVVWPDHRPPHVRDR